MNRCIIGLGNPGPQYQNTPHNAGMIVLDALAASRGCEQFRYQKMLEASTASCGDLQFIKPQTYMNRSGKTAGAVAKTMKVDLASALVVIHDDIDLPLGAIKLISRGGAGGHNGVRSIVDALGTDEFVRIKLGVAPTDANGQMQKPPRERVNSYLLSPMSARSKEIIEGLVPRIDEALQALVEDGVESAMKIANTDQ